MYTSSLIQPILPDPEILDGSLPKGVAPDYFKEFLSRKEKPLIVVDLRDIGRVARIEMVNTQHGEAIQIASFAIAQPKSGFIKLGEEKIVGDYVVPLWRVLAFEGKGAAGDYFLSSRVLYPDLDPPTQPRLLDLAARIERKLGEIHNQTRSDSLFDNNLQVATKRALELSAIRGSLAHAPLPHIKY